jgi:predicted DNA-binding transcriptional regulator AlpA
MNDKDAFSILEFCARHGMSRSAFYNSLKAGQGPRVMKVGSRVMVSREAAAEWRREREQASAKEMTA